MEINKIVGDSTILGEHHYRATGNRFTDDLLVEMFLRPPVKSLCRFACTCKAWHAIIIDNDYYRKKLLPSSMSGLLYGSWYINNSAWNYMTEFVSTRVNKHEHSSSVDISTVLSFLPPHPELVAVNSCNGLILCKSNKRKLKSGDWLYVCNPTIKKYDIIPAPGCHYPVPLALAFDPRISPHYKAVAISIYHGNFHYMQVLSSETCKCRVKYNDGKGLDHPVSFFGYFSVFVHGNIHFLKGNCLFIIVALDIEKKAFREIWIPHAKDLDTVFKH